MAVALRHKPAVCLRTDPEHRRRSTVPNPLFVFTFRSDCRCQLALKKLLVSRFNAV